MDYQQLVLFGECDDAPEKIEVHHLCRRVVGKGDDHHLRPRPHRLDRALGAVEEVPFPAREGDRADVRPGDDHRKGVNRVGRAGDESDVPGTHRGQHEVGQPLFRSDRGDRLRFRVELHAVFPLVPVADGQSQLRIPRESEYLWFLGLRTASTSLSTMCFGVGRSGFPIPRSMMSSPALRNFDLSSTTTAKTYGGKRWILANCSIGESPVKCKQTC